MSEARAKPLPARGATRADRESAVASEDKLELKRLSSE